MKKVILLGDSIRQLGYGVTVAQRLSNEFAVWQPEENCRFAQNTLRMLHDYRAAFEGCDIVHWNNGLWDACHLFGDGPFTPIEQYVDTMVRIATLLQQRAKTVIFASTTPPRAEHGWYREGEIAAYNAALIPRLQERGVVINDLHGLVSTDVLRYIREDDLIHLTDEGIAACAAQVEQIIRQEAAKL